MNEILDRIAAALEKQTELLEKSVALQEEGCVRSRETAGLRYENELLSIERYHLLRTREYLTLFALAGAERSTVFPIVHASYEKWKQALEDIDPRATIGFNLIESLYQRDLNSTREEILKRIERGNIEDISKDMIAALSVIDNFLEKEKKETLVQEMTKNFVQDLMMDEPPRSIATSVDFGIPETLNPQYGALQWGLKREMFTAQELDDACCSGPKLTELVSRGNNPYKCEFHTTWDDMPDEDEDEDEGPDDPKKASF
jgi:hypothetical protein